MARQPAIGGFETNSAASTGSTVKASQLPSVTLESLGAKGDGVTDDTAAFTAAAALGAAHITGKNLNYKISAQFAPGAGNYWDMEGSTVTVSPVNLGVFVDRSLTDGTSTKSGFVLWGGKWVGGGGSTGSLPADLVYLQQWTDVWVCGTQVSNFSDGAMSFSSCSQVWILNNSVSSVSTSGQRNAIRVNDGPFVGSSLFGDHFIMGNYTDRAGSVPNAAVNVSATNGLSVDSRVVVALNDFTVNSAGFAVAVVEVNSYSYRTDVATVTNGSATVTDASILAGDQGNPVSGPVIGTGIPNNTYVGTVTAGVSFLLSSSPTTQVNVNATGTLASVKLWQKSSMQNVLWVANTLTNVGAGASPSGFYIRDSGGAPYPDGTKIQNQLIIGNIVTVNGTGTGSQPLWLEASHSLVAGNRFIQNGSGGRCMLVQATPSVAQVHHILFTGNQGYATNATQTNAMVELDNCQDTEWTGGRVTGSASAGVGDGMRVAGNSVRSKISNVVIDSPAGNGLTYTSMNDARGSDILIRNPNAANNVSSGTNASGLFVQGLAPAGNLNQFENLTAIDDRGGHLMAYGLNLGTTATTPIKFKNVTIQGASQLPMTTTSIQVIGEVTGFSADVMAGYGFNTSGNNTAGASPFTSTAKPYDQMLLLQTVGGLTAMTYSRNTTQLPIVAGTSVYIRRNETVTMTWATTAPTFSLVPLP